MAGVVVRGVSILSAIGHYLQTAVLAIEGKGLWLGLLLPSLFAGGVGIALGVALVAGYSAYRSMQINAEG